MTKIKVDLQNCYGIKKLNEEFDFSNGNTIAIYAPNGVMKTSFANTFYAFQKGKYPEERLFNLDPSWELRCDDENICSNSNKINKGWKDKIFVIKPFGDFESDKLADLLVNSNIKKSLDTILQQKESILIELENLSGLKIVKTTLGNKVYEIENAIFKDFKFETKSILQNINSIVDKINGYNDTDYSDINYSNLFVDEKILLNDDFQSGIENYIKKTTDIYKDYKFLKGGDFGIARLKNVEKKLDSEKFFKAGNKLYLDGREVDQVLLRNQIEEIENKLIETVEYKKIEKLLSTANGLKIKEEIEKNIFIIEDLESSKITNLKQNIWIVYFKKLNKIQSLSEKYNNFKNDIESVSIRDTKWKKAVKIFKERFFVPFEMDIENKESVVIGESLPKVIFKFKKPDGGFVIKNKDELSGLDILSQGEKRALYLLNIILEIEARKENNQESLFIIDDVADSFDYKNKYAIIEYLKEISEYEKDEKKLFNLIILTHNFDFFRTVKSRIIKGKEKDKLKFLLYAKYKGEEIILEKQIHDKEPFQIWKDNLTEKNIIALIPFVRNLIEYGKDNKEHFQLLTHALHIKNHLAYNQDGKYLKLDNSGKILKEDENHKPLDVGNYNEDLGHFKTKKTEDIAFKDIKHIYKEYIGKDDFEENLMEKSVLQSISDVTDDIIKNLESTLENKIILAIACRLEAEKFMICKINNENTVDKIPLSQTSALLSKMKGVIKAGNLTLPDETLSILDKVNLMTPENIHLNSFMYEPILDMGMDHLVELYKKVKALNE
jgi:hypothetical protein